MAKSRKEKSAINFVYLQQNFPNLTLLLRNIIYFKNIKGYTMELIKNPAYKAIAEASPLAFVVWTPDFKIIDWNKSAERIFGWRREEVIGKNFYDFLIPESAESKVRQIVEKLKAGELPSYSINENLTKDGSIIKCEWHNTVLKDKQGKITTVISMAQDVTERERMKERLQKEHNLLQTLMDNIPDSIYFKDDKNRFVMVNRAKAEHSGTTPDNMVGKTDFDFSPKEQAKKSFADDTYVMKSGRSIIDKVEKIIHSNGKEYWVSVTKVPWRNNKGKIIGTMGISRDITRRKGEQEEIENLGRLYRLIGRSINRSKTIKELSSRILKGLRKIIDFDFGDILIYDPEKNTLFCSTQIGYPKDLKEKTVPKKSEEGIAGAAAIHKEPIYIDNPKNSKLTSVIHSLLKKCGIKLQEVYAVPLMTRGTLHGVLQIGVKEGKNLSRKDRRLIKSISEEIAAGIAKIKAEEALRELAIKDPLTGLFNYRHFWEVLEKQKDRFKRYNEVYSLLYIDIDNFKECNDTYGHQEGDKVLKTLSGILKNNLRRIDSAYRIGGEEFVVLLPHTSKQKAKKVAERIQKEVHQKLYLRCKVTVSIGVADSKDGENIVKIADSAMYEAKRKGKDRIWVAGENTPFSD